MSKLGRIEIEIVEGDVRKSCTFHHSTVRKLLNHIDAIEAEKDQLIDNVAQLQKDLTTANTNTDLAILNAKQWQDELLRVQSAAKVVLPKDVADALDTAKQNEWYKDDSEYLLWVVMQSPEHNDDDEEVYIVSLRKYANENKASDLSKAILFGYTVEEEPTAEEKLRTEWTPLLEEILEDYTDNGESVPLTQAIIDQLLPLTRKVIKATELEQHE